MPSKLTELVTHLELEKKEQDALHFCWNFTRNCYPRTIIFCYWGCTFRFSDYCRWGCTIYYTPIGCHITEITQCTPTYIDPLRRFSEIEFKEIQENIAELQKQIETRFKSGGIEDLNAMERKLTEALDEVKEQKANLKRG